MLQPEVVAETLEPGHLEPRVLDGQSRVHVGPHLAEGARIAEDGVSPWLASPASNECRVANGSFRKPKYVRVWNTLANTPRSGSKPTIGRVLGCMPQSKAYRDQTSAVVGRS